MSPGTQQKTMLKNRPQKIAKYAKMTPKMDPRDALKHQKTIQNLVKNTVKKSLRNKHQKNMIFCNTAMDYSPLASW